MASTLIRGGEVVLPGGAQQADVLITDGVITAVEAPGQQVAADETIDASGLTVLPGLIDVHSHHREPGFTHKEDIITATQACAAGGVTTSFAMPNVYPPPNNLANLEAMMRLYEEKSIVNWNINPAGTIPVEMPAMAATGIAAFKVFMVVDTGRDYPHMPGIGLHDHGQLMEVMEVCAELDVPLMVHPHDQALMDHIEAKFWAKGERDALAYAKAYAYGDGVIWESAIATLLRLQQATDCRLHLLHVQTAGSVDLIRAAKDKGQRVSAEINPWALFLGNDWANIERLGSYALSYWVPEKNTEPLWAALADGTVDLVSTDHAPHTHEEKQVGWEDGWKAHTGTPSTQFYIRMLLDAVRAGRMSIERFVEVTAGAPARLFGLDTKGAIRPGADADLVIVDRNREATITTDEVLSRIGHTPYEGMTFTGLPVRTIVGGTTVFLDGDVVGAPGTGSFARRNPGKVEA